jgi:hypothetical protein
MFRPRAQAAREAKTARATKNTPTLGVIAGELTFPEDGRPRGREGVAGGAANNGIVPVIHEHDGARRKHLHARSDPAVGALVAVISVVEIHTHTRRHAPLREHLLGGHLVKDDVRARRPVPLHVPVEGAAGEEAWSGEFAPKTELIAADADALQIAVGGREQRPPLPRADFQVDLRGLHPRDQSAEKLTHLRTRHSLHIDDRSRRFEVPPLFQELLRDVRIHTHDAARRVPRKKQRIVRKATFAPRRPWLGVPVARRRQCAASRPRTGGRRRRRRQGRRRGRRLGQPRNGFRVASTSRTKAAPRRAGSRPGRRIVVAARGAR